MKVTFKAEAEFFEEGELLQTFFHAHDYRSDILDALNHIRNRRKHYDISDEEDDFLQTLWDILNHPSLN